MNLLDCIVFLGPRSRVYGAIMWAFGVSLSQVGSIIGRVLVAVYRVMLSAIPLHMAALSFILGTVMVVFLIACWAGIPRLATCICLVMDPAAVLL